jgi:hypothetical protein
MDGDSTSQTLWQLRKDGHAVRAVMRVVHQIGVELRFLFDGEFYQSQLFTPSEQADLFEAAAVRRRQLEDSGWRVSPG